MQSKVSTVYRYLLMLVKDINIASISSGQLTCKKGGVGVFQDGGRDVEIGLLSIYIVKVILTRYVRDRRETREYKYIYSGEENKLIDRIAGTRRKDME